MNKSKTLFGMCWVMFDYDTKLLKEVVIRPYRQTNEFENTIKADTPEQVRKLMNEYMEKYNLFSNTIHIDLNKNQNKKTNLGERHCLRYQKGRA